MASRGFWTLQLSTLGYLVVVLACLREWGSTRPWSRIDIFSGTFLVLSVVMAIGLARGFQRLVLRSRESLGEAAGMSYDPETVRWGFASPLAELPVYLDYGHWHLVPALERPVLQGLGLGLAVAAGAWLLWTDAKIVQHFADDSSRRRIMTGGPYRHMRHPRYSSLLAGKVAFALVFASVVGWLLVLVWVAVLLRRMRLEEAHVRDLFGADYEAYARRTKRLLPGIY